jgi:hypothetical protein
MTAYRVGKIGYKGTKAFREVIAAIRKGGNFVVGSEEEGVKLLKEAFPDIKQDASGAASAFGYRIDREGEEVANGKLRQGHTGTHINYYKGKDLKGSITIIPEEKTN